MRIRMPLFLLLTVLMLTVSHCARKSFMLCLRYFIIVIIIIIIIFSIPIFLCIFFSLCHRLVLSCFSLFSVCMSVPSPFYPSFVSLSFVFVSPFYLFPLPSFFALSLPPNRHLHIFLQLTFFFSRARASLFLAIHVGVGCATFIFSVCHPSFR